MRMRQRAVDFASLCDVAPNLKHCGATLGEGCQPAEQSSWLTRAGADSRLGKRARGFGEESRLGEYVILVNIVVDNRRLHVALL
jgi:hypothetical protein